MKIKYLYSAILFLGCMLFNGLFSQDKGVYLDNTMISIPNAGQSSSGRLDFITPCSNFSVKEGKSWVKIDLGENYEYGFNNFGIPFEITIALDLKILTDDASIDPSISFTVVLDNNRPESVVYLDLSQYIDTTDTSTGFSYLGNNVNGIEAIVNTVQNTAPTIDITTKLKIALNYEINYGIDVATNVVDNLTYSLLPNSKTIVFDWEDSCESPAYEFQLLRLYNTNTATSTDERSITTEIDWNKALSLLIDGANTAIDLTMGEGQGYYMWRVRPVGTFYENSIGNNKNWGTWNAINYPDCTTCVFETATVTSQVFFFEDADDDRNFQYSRVFTEENKVSEQITYATTLNQVIQTQRYIPSKDYKVITQTVLDNSGRPTLNTLPVPIVGEKISSYKGDFLSYSAADFDSESTYDKPAMIDATGAFEYYSGANADKRIPDAEGYPFTRVLFSNDGTDRVIEQSGVGKTHMIGNTVDGKTRTTRTLYATPTEDELVQLFGDEAPNHEEVAKIITVDPNNTRSVAYITKEGNTIATGLTFSEDDDVLDSVKDANASPVISGVTDKITNNIKTTNGFMASKRITILQDNTELDISYTITQQILGGLCHNLEPQLDYKINIEIFDVQSGEVVEQFEESSIKNLGGGSGDITIDFGTVILNTGTYYIQKTLVPSDEIKVAVVTAEENIGKLIKPFFDWIENFSNRIDCEEEMQFLYNDIFHFGKLIHDQQLISSATITTNAEGIPLASVKFSCDNCSQETTLFRGKDPNDPKAPDEFMDYYEQNKESYGITISYFNSEGDLKVIDFAKRNSLGNIKPVKVKFTTPCCEFEIPILFTPPFRTPPNEAVIDYKAEFHEDVIESIFYYNEDSENPLTDVNPNNEINPNPNFILDTERVITYNSSEGNYESLDLEKTEGSYALDFEGYAISMLYECKKGPDPNYTREQAAEEIYLHLRGWHRPGVFNRMVYHMATDKYVCDPNAEPELVTDTDGNDAPRSNYELCDIPEEVEKIEGTNYSIQELVDCWEPLVLALVNELCVGAFELNDNADDNVASSYDDRRDSQPSAEEEFSDNINNFIIRWISKPKLIRKLRSQNASGSAGANSDDAEKEGGAKDEAKKELENLANTFLKCTGYAFADIIDQNQELPMNGEGEDFVERAHPILPEPYTIYDRNRLSYPGIEDADGNNNWSGFNLKIGETIPRDHTSYTAEEQLIIDEGGTVDIRGGIVEEFFPFIKDPIFAFKYFEYIDGSYPILEAETCYRDPNICLDISIDPETGKPREEEFACCGEDNEGKPIPCDFCDSGYITCLTTKDDWSCDQRFTFYGLIKNYREEVVPDLIPITCENYFEATSYVYNPDYGKDPTDENETFILEFVSESIPSGSITSIEYLSQNLFVDYDPDGGYITNPYSSLERVTSFRDINGGSGSNISLAENMAWEMIAVCKGNCEDRKDEFELKLKEKFLALCYEIGGCKIDPNDNIIPEGDIDKLVVEMIKQCKRQCEISTYACVDESCRVLGAPTRVDRSDPKAIEAFTIAISFVDHGVSGPIVDGLSERHNEDLLLDQLLKYYNPLTGETIETNEPPLIEPIGTAGFLKYSYNNSSYPVRIWDIRQSMTYAQSVRWKQAMEWVIDFDVPSKCDMSGNYNPDLTYDSNNLPIEPVYVFDKKTNTFIEQDFSICTDQEGYVNRKDKPDGPGDTFVERDEYIKNTKTAYDPGNTEANKPVVSPKAGINLNLTPDE